MDVKVLSDDGEVLRLEMTGRIVRDDPTSGLQSFDDFLGPGGYNRNVLLSLAETTFVDPSSLGWLLKTHKRFCKEGGKLVIHSIQPHVMASLEMVHFERTLHIAKDETTALELLRAEN